MEAEIQSALDRIADEHQITILWACESGSRAWGFPSPDSDYDVRFIYVHPPASYLRVFERRDVIEEPISGRLDVNGWDIRKALGLLRKSNPALMEWLSSPIVYRRHAEGIAPLRELSSKAFLPRAASHHYLSMAKQDIRKLVIGSDIRLKKYLYMFRSLLACQWVIDRGTQPPMRFQELLQAYLPSGDIRDQIDELLDLKMQVLESEIIPAQEELDEYLLRLYGQLEKRLPGMIDVMDDAVFDRALLATLQSLWPNMYLPAAH